MRTTHAIIVAALIVGTSCPANARADDDAIATSTTGTILGVVRFEGTPPPRAHIEAHVNHEVCGARSPLLREDLVVSPQSELANVVVFLEGVSLSAPPPPMRGRLEQKNCTFVPHVQSLTVGSEIEIGNSDPVIHNVHAYLKKRTVFNMAMPLPRMHPKRKLEETGIIALSCDSGHTWMSAFIAVIPHPFHATSDGAGRFTIKDVPAGTHRVRAWHELLGTMEQEVTITAGKSTEVTFSFAPERESVGEGDAKLATTKSIDTVTAKLGELQGAISKELAETKSSVEGMKTELLLERKRRIADAARPLFMRHCATCHGPRGDGRGPSAKFLATMPRDFTRGEYKFRMTPSGASPRVEDVYRTITLGVLGTEMPPWREVLSESDRRALAEYVLTFWERWGEEPPEPAITITAEPKTSEGSIAHGKALFEQLQCAQCHGPTGAGDGPSAATMVDGWGNPIRPANLTRDYYKGGRGAHVVYRTIVTGLSGSPMPSFGDLLSEEERWDLAHYITSLGAPRSLFDRLFGDPAGRMTSP